MRYVKALMTIAAVLLYDLRQALVDRWQVHVRRLHKTVLRETEGIRGEAIPGRFAVVALYPSSDSLPFSFNLLDALAESGFWVLVVSTRRLAAAQLAALAGRAHRVIERESVGRDFASYQMGIEWLGRHRPLDSAELLILANDSVFYPKAFAAELRTMLQNPGEWQSLFESYEFDYHAQSFFLLFRTAVLGSQAFHEFWRQYKPYSARTHAINNGEFGLSSSLKNAEFVCAPAYSSLRLAEALADEPLPLLEILELVPVAEPSAVSKRKVFDSILDLQRSGVQPSSPGEPIAGAAPQEISGAEMLLSQFWSSGLMHQFETVNPTHPGALICNRLFVAPIKRDVCYRGTFDIHQIVRWASGFDAEEVAAMHRDLRARGLGWRMSGLRRMLFLKGRI